MLQQIKVRKTLTLPAALVEILEEKGARMGFDFPEFVRYVLANEAKSEVDRMYRLSPAEEKSLGKGIEDYENGKYVSLDSDAQIEEFVSRL